MSDEYVSNRAWLHPAGRPDAIDEVADAFERPSAGSEAFWRAEETARWPRAPRGWAAPGHRPASGHRPAPALERRAG